MIPTDSATALLRIGTAFYDAQVLLAAVELDLFSGLASGPASAAEIQQRIGLHPGPLADWLEALAALDLVEKDGDRYRNSLAADRYLVRSKDSYIGEYLRLNHRMLYPTWGRLADTLRTGESQLAHLVEDGKDPFDLLYADQHRLRGFVAGMSGLVADVGPALAAAVPWQRYRSFADLGGAAGSLSAAIVRAHPHLQGTTFDLAALRPLFDERVAALGTRPGQLVFVAGDFFTDPLPAADVLILGHVLHDWPEDRRRTLIDRAAAALGPGGALVIYDMMVWEDDASGSTQRNVFSYLQSLNMALTVGAGEYSVNICEKWVRDAGLQPEPATRLAERDTLLVARKPVA